MFGTCGVCRHTLFVFERSVAILPRIRDPNRDKSFEIYKDNNGNIDLVEIASQLNVPPGTIRGWKAKDCWEQKLNGTLQKERNVPKGKSPPKSKQNKKPLDGVEQIINNPDLTDKQRLFCLYQIKYFNATKAYQKAYGCDYITANVNGSRLLAKASIQEEIKRLKQAKLNQATLEPEDIFQKYMDIAFSDVTDYLAFGRKEIVVDTDEDGNEVTAEINYVDFKDSNQVDGTLISEVKQGKDGVSIKLADRMKALQWIADHMDLATEEQRAKIALLKAKVTSDDEEEGQEDDGFIDALKGQVNDIWED